VCTIDKSRRQKSGLNRDYTFSFLWGVSDEKRDIVLFLGYTFWFWGMQKNLCAHLCEIWEKIKYLFSYDVTMRRGRFYPALHVQSPTLSQRLKNTCGHTRIMSTCRFFFSKGDGTPVPPVLQSVTKVLFLFLSANIVRTKAFFCKETV